MKHAKRSHAPFGTLPTPAAPGLRFCIISLILGVLLAAAVLFYPVRAMPEGEGAAGVTATERAVPSDEVPLTPRRRPG